MCRVLFQNNLSGAIPDSIGKLSSLIQLWVAYTTYRCNDDESSCLYVSSCSESILVVVTFVTCTKSVRHILQSPATTCANSFRPLSGRCYAATIVLCVWSFKPADNARVQLWFWVSVTIKVRATVSVSLRVRLSVGVCDCVSVGSG